jgi:hypothetical protein
MDGPKDQEGRYPLIDARGLRVCGLALHKGHQALLRAWQETIQRLVHFQLCYNGSNIRSGSLRGIGR